MGYVEVVELIIALVLLYVSYHLTPNPEKARIEVRMTGIGLVPVLCICLSCLLVLTMVKYITMPHRATTAPTTQNVER